MITNTNNLKLLVAIASYGTSNDEYLFRLLDEYRLMPFNVDVVVLSNIHKQLPPAVKLKVGLLTPDPWSLPHGHKQLFADELDNYDVFIYSEDDHLITERNIRAFLAITPHLPNDEIAGFLVSEQHLDGNRSYPGIHGHFHWDAASPRVRGPYTVAFLTNEHTACYLATQEQLRHAIDSTGFLVAPHQGKYDLLCTAATDIYTQCGFKKVTCISHIGDFTVRHLPNKYVGVLGISERELERQVATLMEIGSSAYSAGLMFPTETRLPGWRYSKSFYELPRSDLSREVPLDAGTLLSVGCGAGLFEESIARRGVSVTAIPLDRVISSTASARGIRVMSGEDLGAIQRQLARERFDCVFLSSVLHLWPDPIELLSMSAQFLSPGGSLIVSVPNLAQISLNLRKRRSGAVFSYETSGVHVTSKKIVRSWFAAAGLTIERFASIVPDRVGSLNRLSLRMLNGYLASEFVVAARRQVDERAFSRCANQVRATASR